MLFVPAVFRQIAVENNAIAPSVTLFPTLPLLPGQASLGQNGSGIRAIKSMSSTHHESTKQLCGVSSMDQVLSKC